MSVGDPVGSVRSALHDLRNVLNADRWSENAGLKANPIDAEAAWSKFKIATTGVIDVIQHPQPGQGIGSLWLRSVYDRAAKVSANVRAKGWPHMFLHDDEHLLRLVTSDWERGYYVARYRASREVDFPELNKTTVTPFGQLQELSQLWSVKYQQLVEQAGPGGGATLFHLFHSCPEMKRAGELLLEAIDACEVNRDVLEDAELRHQILRNIETPEALVWGLMTGAVAENLSTLVERLIPVRIGEEAAETSPHPKYPQPKNYARDMWIYDNMGSLTCQSLSVELEIFGRPRGWKIIKSRNAIKNAADTYAIHRGLPTRRFTDDKDSG